MENTRVCPMDTQICKILTSSYPKNCILNALNILQKIISGLLCPSSQNRYRTLDKKDPILSRQLFNIEPVHEFLLFIGYHEEKGSYGHGMCDETMKILEDAFKLLSYRTSQYRDCDFTQETEIQEKENVASDNLLPQEKPRRNKECKITSFLMRHLRKEQIDPISAKYQNKKSACSNFAYNSEGYFHQSGNNETIRKKDPRKDIFEEHEKSVKNKGFSFFSLCKRK